MFIPKLILIDNTTAIIHCLFKFESFVKLTDVIYVISNTQKLILHCTMVELGYNERNNIKTEMFVE